MSKRSYVKDNVVYDCGLPKSPEECSAIINNLEETASKWQYKCEVKDKRITELQKQLLDTQEENQKLKDRWQKLQDDLMLFYTVGNTSDSYGYDVYKSIFDRMKELEKEKNNEVRNS